MIGCLWHMPLLRLRNPQQRFVPLTRESNPRPFGPWADGLTTEQPARATVPTLSGGRKEGRKVRPLTEA